MFEIIKTMFIGLLTGLFNHTKFVSLSNQKCTIQPTLIDLPLINRIKNFTTIHLKNGLN